ncbi:MAG: NAD(P)/FAD-dependent oxidoreductase [Desulfobacteraceae bacterium]|nr:MAG: NAD(P)/FAD-dependent oxidoreductase [Desulfobacteraceae bacterium]
MLKDGEKGVILQRDKQTYAIAPHVPCGVITPDLLRKIADAAEKYNIQALKITSAARIAMIGIQEEDVDSIWQDLGMTPGHAVGLCIRSIKCCPGNQFCRLGQQDSLAMGMQLDEIYHGLELPSKTKMGVSGCPNQCAETWIKDIGLVGKKNGWALMVGGAGASKPRLAEVLLEDLRTEDAIAAIRKVVAFYQENGKKLERIGKMIDRIGLEALRTAVQTP